MSANDADDGNNGKITYKITPDGEGNYACFTIHPRNGEIKSNCILDREKKQTYKFLVKASDEAVINERR